MAVDSAVREHRQADWRSNSVKTRKVRFAIKAVLKAATAKPGVEADMASQVLVRERADALDGVVEQVLSLVKHHDEY
jgi:hypothetical protein